PPIINVQDKQNFKLSNESKSNLTIRPETSKSQISEHFSSQSKKTLPVVKIVSLPDSTTPQDQDKTNTFEHVPLRLPNDDRY
ncbi:MAG: hypothetical protein NT079_05790, partial [Candidatus Omnitrophica bacterium]|nr:hypothetical protein [Candidatus Omnitrophota bacterium]